MSAAAASADIKAKVSGVDFFQGAINTVEGIIGSLSAGLVAAKDPKNPNVSATPDGGGKFFGTVSNVEAAIGKLGELAGDAKKKDVREGVADGVDLLTLAFATLDTWGIQLPVVTAIFRGGFNLHDGGVNKPA